MTCSAQSQSELTKLLQAETTTAAEAMEMIAEATEMTTEVAMETAAEAMEMTTEALEMRAEALEMNQGVPGTEATMKEEMTTAGDES